MDPTFNEGGFSEHKCQSFCDDIPVVMKGDEWLLLIGFVMGLMKDQPPMMSFWRKLVDQVIPDNAARDRHPS